MIWLDFYATLIGILGGTKFILFCSFLFVYYFIQICSVLGCLIA